MPTQPGGDHPSPDLLADYAAYRLDADRFEEVFSHLEGCPRCARAVEEMPDGGLTRRVRAAADAASAAEDPSAPPSAPPSDGRGGAAAPSWPQIPGCEILGEVGRGGAGVVYRARQPALDRSVAVKMLRSEWADAGELGRFRREGRAVAGLAHPNIVSVFEVGETGGRPYAVMEFVAGGTLHGRIAGVPQPPRDAARLLETLARAAAALHSADVVHRDLKPANVLLTADGVPKIADFGLARRLDATAGLTRTGALMGTPQYMAPEQARGQAAGPAADIHALGAILYEMLTGRPPFAGDSPASILLSVAESEPPPPRKLAHGLPADLETICLRCLEKSPDRRYASAGDLADDLRRFLLGEPVRARPPSVRDRVAKWTRRNPAVAGLAAAVTLVTAAGLALVTWQWRRAEDRSEELRAANETAERRAADERSARLAEADARREAEERRREAQAQRRRAERAVAEAALDQGLAHFEAGEAGRGLILLVRALELCPPDAQELDRCIRCNLTAWAGYHGRVRIGGAQGTSVTSVAWSPDGKVYLTANVGNALGRPGPAEAALFDAATGERIGRPAAHPAPIRAVAFSPDGRTFATGSFDGAARLWTRDREGARPQGVPLGHPGRVLAVAFAPDGKRLLTACTVDDPARGRTLGGELRVWDISGATPAPTPQTLALPAASIAGTAVWSPDGQRIAAAITRFDPGTGQPAGGEVRLWEARTGRALGEGLRHADPVTAVAFAPDGRRLASGSEDRIVRFWDVASGRRVGPQVVHPRPVTALAYGPDGATLATACGSAGADGYGDARVWDAETGRALTRPLVHHPVWELLGHGLVHGLAWSPDGRSLLTACRDGRERVWDVSGAALPAAHRFGGPIAGLACAANADRWAAAVRSPDGPDRLYVGDGRGGDAVELPPAPAAIAGLALSRDGKRLVAWDRDRRLHLWTEDRALSFPRTILAEDAVSAEIRPDGSLLAAVRADGTVLLRPLSQDGSRPDGNRPDGTVLSHAAAVRSTAFSPDGRLLATGGADGRARLWSVPDGVAVGEAMPHPAAVVRLVFRPDGRTLLSVSHSPTETRIWDVPSGTPAEPPRRHGKYADVHPGDDGRLALLADRHKGAPAVRLMDMRTGRTVVAMPPETSGRAAFHPPGERMAVSEGDDRIRLWDTAAGRPLGPPLPQPGAAEAHLGFAPDGRVLYAGGSGGAGGAVRSWRVPEPMEGRPATIRLRLQLLTQLTDVDSGSVRALGPEELDDLRRQLMRKTDAVPSGAE